MGDREDPGDARSLWRIVFDAVERPLTDRAQANVRSDPFMDGLALAWRSGRRVEHELRRSLELGLGTLRVATRGDVDRLSSELARVHRELRAVHDELRVQARDAQSERGG